VNGKTREFKMANIAATELLALIKRRRTVRSFCPDKPVDEASLQRVLEAGTWAPYAPYRPQGWKFIALRGKQRDQAVAIITKSKTILKYIRYLYENAPYAGEIESPEEHRWKDFASYFAQTLGEAPVVVIGLVPYDRSTTIRGHSLGSAWAAVQNMMLQAQVEGLASGVVSFQSPTVEKQLVEFLGLDSSSWIVAFVLNVGHAKVVPSPAPRQAGLVEIR